jgi:predicted Zn finger-like uncharacterized protein
MYITCPKCSTSFVVSAEQIGPGGRRVRCSKCKHTWRAKLPAVYKPPVLDLKVDVAKAPESGIHLPVLSPVVKRKKPGSLLYTAFAALILSVAVIFVVKRVDFSDVMPPNHENLKISEVTVYHLPPAKIVARYRVENHSSKATAMPHFRIRLYDKAHKLLENRRISVSKTSLEPNQSLNLRIPLQGVSSNVHSIDVSPSRWWDFF